MSKQQIFAICASFYVAYITWSFSKSIFPPIFGTVIPIFMLLVCIVLYPFYLVKNASFLWSIIYVLASLIVVCFHKLSGYGFAHLNRYITSLSAKYLQRIGNNMLIGTDYLSNIYVDNDVYKSIDNGYGDGITLIVSRDGKTLRTATHFISRISSDIIENLEPTALANNYQLSSAYFPNLKTISNFTF